MENPVNNIYGSALIKEYGLIKQLNYVLRFSNFSGNKQTLSKQVQHLAKKKYINNICVIDHKNKLGLGETLPQICGGFYDSVKPVFYNYHIRLIDIRTRTLR